MTAFNSSKQALGEISWDKTFSKNTYEYNLTLPAETKYVTVVPVASNKNYQVRKYVGTVDVTKKGYKPDDYIPVDGNTSFSVVSAHPDWPSMNTSDAAVTYLFNYSIQKIAVTSVSLDKTELELGEGLTATLTATVLPENATNKKVTWSSGDEKICR